MRIALVLLSTTILERDPHAHSSLPPPPSTLDQLASLTFRKLQNLQCYSTTVVQLPFYFFKYIPPNVHVPQFHCETSTFIPAPTFIPPPPCPHAAHTTCPQSVAMRTPRPRPHPRLHTHACLPTPTRSQLNPRLLRLRIPTHTHRLTQLPHRQTTQAACRYPPRRRILRERT